MQLLRCPLWGQNISTPYLAFKFNVCKILNVNTQCMSHSNENPAKHTSHRLHCQAVKSIYIDKGVRAAKPGKQELFAFTWGQVPTNCGTPIGHLLFFSCLSKNKHHMMSVFILLSCTLWLEIVYNIALKILILVGWLSERILLQKMIFSRNAQIHTHTHTHTHTKQRCTWVTPRAG